VALAAQLVTQEQQVAPATLVIMALVEQAALVVLLVHQVTLVRAVTQVLMA
jgi:hypothetical protein